MFVSSPLNPGLTEVKSTRRYARWAGDSAPYVGPDRGSSLADGTTPLNGTRPPFKFSRSRSHGRGPDRQAPKQASAASLAGPRAAFQSLEDRHVPFGALAPGRCQCPSAILSYIIRILRPHSSGAGQRSCHCPLSARRKARKGDNGERKWRHWQLGMHMLLLSPSNPALPLPLAVQAVTAAQA